MPRKPTPKKTSQTHEPQPKLLSGGNPQIPKGDGDAVVQAYLDAMPGWKQTIGRRLDTLLTNIVPGLRKAVRWNTPFYGSPDETLGWFLSFHCFDRYVKVAFHNGSSLDPPPPIASKHPTVRYCHLHEGDAIDETRFVEWVRQSSALPGETCF